MIDPTNITNFDLNDYQLEETLLWWVCASGKNGRTAAKCLDNLLQDNKIGDSNPFTIIKRIKNLPQEMKKHGIGCFNHKAKTFLQLVNSGLNLRTCSEEDLLKIWGIGLKTARCFIMHSRKDQKLAGLDTHALKFLADLGYDVPKSTPTQKKYEELQKIFLSLTDNPTKLDLEVWNAYSLKNKKAQNKLIEKINVPI